jgi:hypothetical protein
MSQSKSIKNDYIFYTECKNEQGQLHCVNGPALEYKDGSYKCYINGKLQSMNKPSVKIIHEKHIWTEWWINDYYLFIY